MHFLTLIRRFNMFFDKAPSDNKIIIKDLINILSIIDKKDHWCQRSLARDINNESVFNPYDEKAVKFCILGAAYKVESSKETISFLENVSLKNGYSGIDRVNDLHNHEDIIKFLLACLDGLGYNTRKLKRSLK